MSYILEALKKSDQERQRNSVPNLQTHHILPPGTTSSSVRKKRRRRVLSGLAVLVGLSAITIALIWLKFLPVSFDLNIAIERQSPSVPVTTTPKEGSQGVADTTQLNQVPLSPASQPATGEVNQQSSLESISQTVPAVPPAITPDEPQQTSLSKLPPPAEPVESSAATGQIGAVQAAPLQQTKVQPISETTQYPDLSQLPEQFRSALPELKYAGHTYASDPQKRLIIVNNTIRREGDSVAPGVWLREITWDGIVLSFRGTQFQVNTTKR